MAGWRRDTHRGLVARFALGAMVACLQALGSPELLRVPAHTDQDAFQLLHRRGPELEGAGRL